MDMFTGWPFYRPRGCWDEPEYGYYPGRSHGRMGPGYYDHPSNPFEPQWNPNSPFHMPNMFSSPFYRRNFTAPDDMFDADRSCPHRTRRRVQPEPSTSKQSETAPVTTRKCADKSEKAPVDDTAPLSPATADDTTSSLPGEVTESSTVERQQVTKAEEPQTDTVPVEVKKIQEIVEKSGEFEEKISTYDGVLGSKGYIFIEESLVAILLQLDKIDTNGNLDIRKARKSAVCKIQEMLTDLENKAKSNMSAMETESTNSTTMSTNETADSSSMERQPEVESEEENEKSTSSKVKSNMSAMEAEPTNNTTMSAGETADTLSMEQQPEVEFEEENEKSISDNDEMSNTVDSPPAVNSPSGIDAEKLASDNSTVETVCPPTAAETSSSQEAITTGDEHDCGIVENGLSSCNTESMDCTPSNEDSHCDISLSSNAEDSIVNTSS